MEMLSEQLEHIIHRVLLLPAATIMQLVFFTLVILGLFLIRLMIRRDRIRKSRQVLPLVIGGWGTRGKSGTERKKAALFSALGFNVVSKTTGCEAMIIHAAPGVKPTELPIYRPGNKATIWEQEKVVRYAANLNAQVFLWECMALGSDYAELMQLEWMNDDISTISNTFVDHENIQGPAGVDVARSLTAFIPVSKKLITAEEHMLPIIREKARMRNTELITVDWHESVLFGQDVLERFPYRIHERNLALVQKLGSQFGLDTDFMLKEIADNIVPDLGAFKRFEAFFKNRRFEFWNGMSANDETSSISNWRLAGFEQFQTKSDEWVVTLVNNRDDRIARSHEFADILVNLTPAHMHVLIGTNLTGFYGYIVEAAKRFAQKQSEFSNVYQEISPEDFYQRLRQQLDTVLNFLRVDGSCQEHIQKKLIRMTDRQITAQQAQKLINEMLKHKKANAQDLQQLLSHLEFKTDDFQVIIWHLHRDLKDYMEIENYKSKLEKLYHVSEVSGSLINTLQINYQQMLINLIKNRFEVIEDSHISGDGIVDWLSRYTPPGYHIKIMGMQNIKGTGLDFVYRWMSLANVQSAAFGLQSKDMETRRRNASWFADHDDYGILDVPYAIAVLEEATGKPENQNPEMKSLLTDAIRKVKRFQLDAENRLKNHQSSNFGLKIISLIEQILDQGDSKRRRRKVKKIMKDLFHGRISHGRAARELHDINKRQDGGWLIKSLFRH